MLFSQLEVRRCVLALGALHAAHDDPLVKSRGVHFYFHIYICESITHEYCSSKVERPREKEKRKQNVLYHGNMLMVIMTVQGRIHQ